MRKDVYDRVIEEAKYLINYGSTIREIAKVFDVSKSTVHKDMREKLLLLDSTLYQKVSSVLEYHTYIKHIRGGQATKDKFLDKKGNLLY
mgnify:FL=1